MMRGFVSATRSRAKLLRVRLGRGDLAHRSPPRQLRRATGGRARAPRRRRDCSTPVAVAHGVGISSAASALPLAMRARYASANAAIQMLTPVASCSDRSTGGRWPSTIAAATTSCSTPSVRDGRRGALRDARLAAAEHAARQADEVQHDEHGERRDA